MTLFTENPLATPCVEELEIRADVRVSLQKDQPKLKIVQRQMLEQIRSSHRFSYLSSEAKRAQIFREKWSLDNVSGVDFGIRSVYSFK